MAVEEFYRWFSVSFLKRLCTEGSGVEVQEGMGWRSIVEARWSEGEGGAMPLFGQATESPPSMASLSIGVGKSEQNALEGKEEEEDHGEMRGQTTIAILMVVAYFTAGTVFYNQVPAHRDIILSTISNLDRLVLLIPQVEEWNTVDSLYFCVTTVTTVGYGQPHPRTRCVSVPTPRIINHEFMHDE